MELPLSVNVEGETTQVATAPSDGGSETTDTAVRLKKVDSSYCGHQDLLSRLNLLDDSEIPL